MRHRWLLFAFNFVLNFALPVRALAAPVDLLSASRAEISGPGDVWSPEMQIAAGQSMPLRIHWTFHAAAPSDTISLTLEKPAEIGAWSLNGIAVPVPLPGMRFATVPAIPTQLLEAGENVLEARWTPPSPREARTIRVADLKVRLLALTPSDLAFTSGPVMGEAGTDHFTVSCRTSLPCRVTLEAGDAKTESASGVIHTLTLRGLKPRTDYRYRLVARAPGVDRPVTLGRFNVRTLPAKAPYTFVAMGDARTRPQMWAKVAAGVVAAKPAFALFSGDLVGSGRDDGMWEADYLSPAREYFASVPTFPVQGNHDEDSPVFHAYFDVEPGRQNWAREFGPALFIGINAREDWTAGSENLRWLAATLAASRAKFIFLVSHYAGWSSGPGGDPKNGILLERPVQIAQDSIIPLLAKSDATAMIAGHSHFYERSEPPGGPTVIITGGAGAPLYQKRADAAVANPHSVAFASVCHSCLFRLTNTTCSMHVIDIDGKVVDTKTLKARTLPGKD